MESWWDCLLQPFLSTAFASPQAVVELNRGAWAIVRKVCRALQLFQDSHEASLPQCPTWKQWRLGGEGEWAQVLLSGHDLFIGRLQLQELCKLGGGGYADVFLCQPVQREAAGPRCAGPGCAPHPGGLPAGPAYAVKKLVVQTLEQLEAAQQELAIHARLPHHPALLPLLDFALLPGPGPSSCLKPCASPGPSFDTSASAGAGHSPGQVAASREETSGWHPPLSWLLQPLPQARPEHRPTCTPQRQGLGQGLGQAGQQELHPALTQGPQGESGGVGQGSLKGPDQCSPQGQAGLVAGVEGGSWPNPLAEAGRWQALPCTLYLVTPAFTDGTLAEELVRLEQQAADGPTPPGWGLPEVWDWVAPLGAWVAPLLPAAEPAGAEKKLCSPGMGLAEGQGRGHGRGLGGGLGGVVLPSSTVLDIFLQLVSGLAALHSAGVAHQDVKPHNILIHRLPAQPSQGQQPLAPHGSGMITAPTGQPLVSGMAMQATAQRQRLYRAVLMDFGSAGPRLMRVDSWRQALQLQEEAEAKCTATFRAPELFDVVYPATLDRAAQDVWAAGCTLYALMYGQSPFQLAINQPGSSLALAVLGGHVAWPHDPLWSYPPALHQLVMECLAQEPIERPSAAQLEERVEQLLNAGLPDPPCLSANKCTGA